MDQEQIDEHYYEIHSIEGGASNQCGILPSYECKYEFCKVIYQLGNIMVICGWLDSAKLSNRSITAYTHITLPKVTQYLHYEEINLI